MRTRCTPTCYAPASLPGETSRVPKRTPSPRQHWGSSRALRGTLGRGPRASPRSLAAESSRLYLGFGIRDRYHKGAPSGAGHRLVVRVNLGLRHSLVVDGHVIEHRADAAAAVEYRIRAGALDKGARMIHERRARRLRGHG